MNEFSTHQSTIDKSVPPESALKVPANQIVVLLFPLLLSTTPLLFSSPFLPLPHLLFHSLNHHILPFPLKTRLAFPTFLQHPHLLSVLPHSLPTSTPQTNQTCSLLLSSSPLSSSPLRRHWRCLLWVITRMLLSHRCLTFLWSVATSIRMVSSKPPLRPLPNELWILDITETFGISPDVIIFLLSHLLIPSNILTFLVFVPQANPLGPSKRSLPTGWTDLGCVTEGTTARTLASYSFYASSVTPETCMAVCKQQGYTIAGVEFGDE